jgi:hypothetical protein
MKQHLKLLPAESSLVKQALSREIGRLADGFKKDWTYVTFNKFDFKKGQAFLDGGEMEIVVIALRKIAHHYIQLKDTKKAIPYFTVACKVNEEKVKYQTLKGPKIEKTASAGTLTA